MSDRRSLTTGEVLGLLAAVLVVLVLLPIRAAATFTVFAVVLAVALTTLGVALSLLVHRGRSLGVVDGFVAALGATVLTVPIAAVFVAVSAGPAAPTGPVDAVVGLVATPATTFLPALPEGGRLAVQWALPASLLFPLGLARRRRARAAVGVAFLVALVVAVAVAPAPDLASGPAAVVRFVAAAFLGGPLFVAARAFPRGPDQPVAGVR
jgi:hypothetical protein